MVGNLRSFIGHVLAECLGGEATIKILVGDQYRGRGGVVKFFGHHKQWLALQARVNPASVSGGDGVVRFPMAKRGPRGDSF